MILWLLYMSASSMSGASKAGSVFPKTLFTAAINVRRSLLKAASSVLGRLELQGKLRPEPDEALWRLQARCRTGLHPLNSASKISWTESLIFTKV